MLKSLIFFVRFYLFWLLFFALDRFLFLFIFHKKLRDIPLGEKLLVFYHSLTLDLSMTAYLAVIPLLIWLFYFFSNKTVLNQKAINIYSKILIVVFSVLGIVNFNIYREWGSKVNARALQFATDTPKEAFASSASSPILFSVLMLIVLMGSAFYLYFILLKNKTYFNKGVIWIKIPLAFLLIFLNFAFIRGGFGTAPNTQSDAYYSRYEILNLSSLNTEWNLISSILASKKTKHHPYLYFKQRDADTAVANLYKVEKDTTVSFLKTNKPNVVIFILESFTADLTKTLGNEDGITPNFDSLINNGLLFSRIYSAGNRTDKGVIATLTGFPTLGSGSIVKWPEKMQKLPAISKSLFNNGYQTSFFYGGESEFDNYKAFILSHNYQTLFDKNNFDKKDMNSKWGAYDGLVFSKQLQHLNKSKQPFFSTVLSLTNHEPFELPGHYKFGNKDNVQKFKSTAHYTDSCINAYLIQAKKQPWYKNTLFVFIADHGHMLPKNKSEIYVPQRYHIPLLFFGDVIKDDFKGKQLNRIGSQQDIASTLLHQIKIPAKEFIWSKNLLNPYTKQFTFFSWDNGFGFLKDQQAVTFDNVGKNVLYNSNNNDKQQTEQYLNFGKSYLQSAYQQFIKL
jgi:phosphoglycerol transferase MdoB-like AlkP superfamily enzyme